MQITKIRLRKPHRVVLFECGGLALKRDEACVVQTDRGQEWGECVLPPEPSDGKVSVHPAYRVVRKANRHDFNTLDMIASEEHRARDVCLAKINKHGLDMKLVDVEYTFDRRKVVFYFTADDRVDFRELVRDLAHELRSRIELRHIQVRDEAKMVGGLGCCGRQLCCASWLDEFKPISMRMAKRQDLSLNPTKISGQCGRLLCCLSYENEMYAAKKKKPKPAEESKPDAADNENAVEPCKGCPEPSCGNEMLQAPVVAEAGPPEEAPASEPEAERKPADKQAGAGAADQAAPARKDAEKRPRPTRRGKNRRRPKNRGGKTD